jgi:hypothetical protein
MGDEQHFDAVIGTVAAVAVTEGGGLAVGVLLRW